MNGTNLARLFLPVFFKRRLEEGQSVFKHMDGWVVPPRRMLRIVSQERRGKPDGALTKGGRQSLLMGMPVSSQGWDRSVLEGAFSLLDRTLKYRNSAALCWGRLLVMYARPDRGVERRLQGMTKKTEEGRLIHTHQERRPLASKGRPDFV